MSDPSPTVRQRRLASELRRIRVLAKLDPASAAATVGISRTKLVRIETATARPKVSDVERLLELYGCDNALRLALVQLARDIRKRGWWHAYDDVLQPSYAELEDDAEKIRSWQIEVIPGLLQTPAYARALIRPHVSDDAEVDRRVQARMTRKTLLDRENAPALSVLLDEAVLRRQVGGTEVMRGQLTALLDAGARPNVAVRVLTADAGLHLGIGEGAFVIFKFPRPIDLDVVYLDSAAGSIYVEDPRRVNRCNSMYDRKVEQALSEEESAALIKTMIKE